MLSGGHAENALPQSATATINCRIFPGTSAADVQKTLQGLVGPKVEVKQGYDALVSDASPMRADVMKAVEKAVAASDPGTPVVPTQAAYATDGAVYPKRRNTHLRRGRRFHHGQRRVRPWPQ